MQLFLPCSTLRFVQMYSALQIKCIIITGRPVVQLVEQVPRIQRLCPHRSRPRFDSTHGPLLHVIPPLSPLFPVHSSAVLS